MLRSYTAGYAWHAERCDPDFRVRHGRRRLPIRSRSGVPGRDAPRPGRRARTRQRTGQKRRARTRRPMTSDTPPVHPDLAPLEFLLGRWEGAGIGGYPTIESFRFGQEISFSHNGKPFLIYASRSWLLDEDGNLVRPLATE